MLSFFRKKEEKRRLRKLYEETFSKYGPGAFWSDRKERYLRWYSNGKELRTMANRRVRRKKNELYSKGLYRKIFDYWWELF